MDRKSLIDRANRWTIPRYGIRVTARMLRDWVDEELVPRPHRIASWGQRAAVYEWPVASYRKVLKIARLKKRGLTTFDQLRITLWLDGNDPVTARIRESMIHEYRSIQNRLNRDQRVVSPDNLQKKINNPKSKRRNIAAKTDPRLSPISKFITERDMAVWTRAALFGGKLNLSDLISPLLGDIFGTSWPADEFQNVPIKIDGVNQVDVDGDGIIPGSAEHSLATLPFDAFTIVRQITRVIEYDFRTGHTLTIGSMVTGKTPHDLSETIAVYKTIGKAMQFYPWKFLLFCLCLHGMRDTYNEQGEVFSEAEKLLPAIIGGDLDKCHMSLLQSQQTLTGSNVSENGLTPSQQIDGTARSS